MANFTPEQEKAIYTHDKNLIVVAGAGSGKTRVLVERYLTLLDENPAWSLNALVAITFTKAAAAEMRERVRKELERRVQSAADAATRQRWSMVLSQMDSARIDTIHGLCATILRANAAQAGVDPKFDVLDEVEANILRDDVIDEVLYDLAEVADNDLMRLFSHYKLHQIREVLTNGTILSDPIASFDVDAEALFEQWRNNWQRQFFDERDRLLKNPDVQAAFDWEPANGWPKTDKLLPAFIAMQGNLANLETNDVDSVLNACDEILSSINLRGGSAKNWGDKEAVDEAKDVLKAIRTFLKDFLEAVGEPPAELDREAAYMLVQWYQLVQQVRDHYANEKHRQGLLDFDDLEARTATLLTTYPDVRERYQGAEFQSLLVDEFQDTNAAQWEIVQALSGLNERTGLFVVGDLKQSIYGFRGADVSVFGNVRQHIGGQSHGEELPLSKSFRSHPGLIESFNKLFEELLVQDPSSPVQEYEIQFDQAMTAFRPPLEEETHQHYSTIEVMLLRNKYSLPESEEEITINAEARRIWEAEQIALRLKQLHDEKAPIFKGSDYAPFDFGDSAVLFQTTTHLTVYENAFRAVGVPFVTIAGRGYYNRQEVWDMLNLLRALHNPSDNLSLAAALRSPMFSFSDDMLLALRTTYEDSAGYQIMPLWEALQYIDIILLSDAERAQIRRAAEILTSLQNIAGRVTISELLRQALAKTGYLAILTGLPNGARLRGNVEKLVDIAEKSGRITLGAFTQYLSDLTAKEAREGEVGLDTSGAVQLMTVHASKGLEFPVVVLADASWDWNRGNRDNDILRYDASTQSLVCKIFDPDENKYRPSYPYHTAHKLEKLRGDAERKRLLYVAATRARDCLIISGELRENKDGERSSSGWLKWMLSPLRIDETTKNDHLFQYTEHGDVRIFIPNYADSQAKNPTSHASDLAWTLPQSDAPASMPPNMHPLNIERQQMLGHIAATQLAGISKTPYKNHRYVRPFYRQNLLRKVLNDAPPRIREAVRVRNPRIQARQVGDVVHEALRYWHFTDPSIDLDSLLSSYAWQQHFIDPDDIAIVVERAKRYLRQFQTSAIYQQMIRIREAGLPFYPELPFVYRTEKRVLHGVIDVLFQEETGEWVALDYKTSYIAGMDKASTTEQQRLAADHAQRYHLQIGAYAAAVQQEVQQTPRACIHYIQYNQTLEIPTAIWRQEIEQLEAHIGDLVNDDDAIIDR